MPALLSFRLSLLLFLQYAVPGAWIPLFTLRLQELNFTPLEIGWACGGSAIGAILAPLIAGQVADRWISSERCIGVCAVIGGGLLLWLAELTSPAAVFAVCLAFWLMMTPIFTLGISLSFTHLKEPARQFGRVRLWGTLGWIVPGLLLGCWYSQPDWLQPVVRWLGRSGTEWADSMRLGGMLAFGLALYTLTLPHTPPARHYTSWLAPLGALHLLRRRRFAVFCFCSCCLYVTMAFWSQLTPLVLKDLGLPREWISPAMTLCQCMEIVLLGLLPWLLHRLGIRGTLLLGVLAWGSGLTVQMLGKPVWLVVAALTLHGVFICCFLITGQVFVNNEAAVDIRASSQGLVTLVNGAGLLGGHLLVGGVQQTVDRAFAPTFAVAVAIVAVVILVLGLGFRERIESALDQSRG